MNYSDTERLETYLEALGFEKTDDETKADLIVFNTCSIKQKAEDKVFGKMPEMGQFKKINPDLKVIITGCMTRISSSQNSEEKDKILKVMKEVDIALKIEDLPMLAKLMREIDENSNIKEIPEEELDHYFKIDATYTKTGKSQAFIPISVGCDKFCTYCIVPFSRGREQSRPITEIIKEAEKLIENGYKELVLLGQTVNSYGLSVYDKIHKDFADMEIPEGKEPFIFLLEELDKLKEKGLKRLRWTSPHPKDVSDQLINAIIELDTQMPYLHMPIQSGDNAMLKRMNRTYTIEKFRDIVQKLRKRNPDISISTDIIVGFCDETEEEFENTYAFFKEMKFEHAYISQYSERTGTFAQKKLNDNIDPEIKNKRWHRINNLLRDQSREALKRFVGREEEALIEGVEDGFIVARNENFKTIRIPLDSIKKNIENYLGKIVKVKILESRDWDLSAEIISS